MGLFDATMLVMGGIIGSGIFINPYVVARLVHTPALILGAWAVGGLIALVGAFIYAELADRMPKVGGQYAYLRDAYHPLVGFLYGWASLFVINGGSSAAIAVTFAKYFTALTHTTIPENVTAIAAVVALTVINCFGVRAGTTIQSTFMLLRIAAVALLVGCGIWFLGHSSSAPHLAWQPLLDRPVSFDLLSVFGATMVPVLFAYGGWQTTNYVASEIREPRRNLPRALLLGVLGVIVLYLSVNFIYLLALAPGGLAETATPASEVMRRALGSRGASLIAAAIAISTVGFLSQAMLTYPRVYFAMAEDGVLPRWFARVNPQSRAPVGSIVFQGFITTALVLLGTYEQILSYVVVMDWLFFALTAGCLLVFRRREKRGADGDAPAVKIRYRVPGYPWTAGVFVVVAFLVVVNTIYKYPRNTGIAVCILLAGIPGYFLFRGPARQSAGSG